MALALPLDGSLDPIESGQCMRILYDSKVYEGDVQLSHGERRPLAEVGRPRPLVVLGRLARSNGDSGVVGSSFLPPVRVPSSLSPRQPGTSGTGGLPSARTYVPAGEK